jgi:hypothetical protein
MVQHMPDQSSSGSRVENTGQQFDGYRQLKSAYREWTQGEIPNVSVNIRL